jgi:Ca2+-transporting ATPase
MKINFPETLTGLTDEEVLISRRQHGSNLQQQKVRSTWWRMMLDILKEPMLVLLVAISIIYFVLQEYGDAYFILAAIIIVYVFYF